MHEFEIMQNYVLGSLALRSFTNAYAKQSKVGNGPPLPLTFPVLPLVFNSRACNILSDVKRITNSRFLNTLSDHRDLPSGLQERMEHMADQTLKTLNLAFALQLIKYDPYSTNIMPVKYAKKIPSVTYGDNQKIIYASRVLGNWFAYYSIEDICISLNIYF